MTTDLRAALREALQLAADALPLIPESSVRDAFARLVALADAPSTVAELLGLIDDNHDVRWQSSSGAEWRAFVTFDDTLAFESTTNGGKWIAEDAANIADLTQPATLVEVTP